MDPFEYTNELEYQNILNNFYISNQIFENYVCDQIKIGHITEKYKIYLLETLADHRCEIKRFKSRNTVY